MEWNKDASLFFSTFKTGNSYHSNALVISACYNVSVTRVVTEKRLMADVPLCESGERYKSVASTTCTRCESFFRSVYFNVFIIPHFSQNSVVQLSDNY